MSDFTDFIYENYKIIIAIILSIFGLLVFISIKGINLNAPKPDTKLVQTVTVETFASNTDNIVDTSIEGGLSEYSQQPALGSLYQSNQSISNTGTDYTQIMPIDGMSNFCNKYAQSPKDLQQACTGLSSKSCQNISCCALIGLGEDNDSTNTCVAANSNGPIFKKDNNDELIAMDHYYYEGTKYNVKQ